MSSAINSATLSFIQQSCRDECWTPEPSPFFVSCVNHCIKDTSATVAHLSQYLGAVGLGCATAFFTTRTIKSGYNSNLPISTRICRTLVNLTATGLCAAGCACCISMSQTFGHIASMPVPE